MSAAVENGLSSACPADPVDHRLTGLPELKADTRQHASEARTRVEHRLEELELHLKAGWAKVNAEVRTKLNHWLERNDD